MSLPSLSQVVDTFVYVVLPAILAVVGWAWRHRAIIQEFTDTTFHAVESLYGGKPLPDGLTKTAAAVKYMEDLANSKKVAITADEWVQIKAKWEAMNSLTKTQKVSALAPDLLQAVAAVAGVGGKPGQATLQIIPQPALTLPAEVAAPPPPLPSITPDFISAVVAEVVKLLPAQTVLTPADEAALVRRGLAMLVPAAPLVPQTTTNS